MADTPHPERRLARLFAYVAGNPGITGEGAVIGRGYSTT
jgi:hypothetical protein